MKQLKHVFDETVLKLFYIVLLLKTVLTNNHKCVAFCSKLSLHCYKTQFFVLFITLLSPVCLIWTVLLIMKSSFNQCFSTTWGLNCFTIVFVGRRFKLCQIELTLLFHCFSVCFLISDSWFSVVAWFFTVILYSFISSGPH